MTSDETLINFATRYAAAWCSQNPDSVAAFYAGNGSLSVNDGPPAVGRAAIAEIARGFMRDFPDMVVTMDDVSRNSARLFMTASPVRRSRVDCRLSKPWAQSRWR